jgi:hypothetical protein
MGVGTEGTQDSTLARKLPPTIQHNLIKSSEEPLIDVYDKGTFGFSFASPNSN